jgi:DNA polymerase
LPEIAELIQGCRRCDLWRHATQGVPGEGPAQAKLMLVGEQPGDQEDLAGRPFVGPAGQLLRTAMSEAGLDPRQAWMTNAVKHFKFAPRGRKRIHQNPNRGEIEHCRWWLGLELAFVGPRVTLALGASAAFSLTGDNRPVSERRGMFETGLHGGPVFITWHPSYILRTQDAAKQARLRGELAADIATALACAAVAPAAAAAAASVDAATSTRRFSPSP